MAKIIIVWLGTIDEFNEDVKGFKVNYKNIVGV